MDRIYKAGCYDCNNTCGGIFSGDVYGGILDEKYFNLSFQQLIKNTLEIKDVKIDFNEYFLDVMNTIAFNVNNIRLYGSSSYKSQPFPSDYDFFEIFPFMGTDIDGAKKLIQAIKVIIEKSRKRGWVMTELKAGFNPYFDIYFGQFRDGKLVEPINKNVIMNHLQKLVKNKLLKAEDYNFINKHLSNKMTVATYDKIKDLLRDYFVLRWGFDDINRGYLTLGNGEKIYLEDAILNTVPERFKEVIIINKIDFEIITGELFKEATNMFLLIKALDNTSYNKLTKLLEADGTIIPLPKDINIYNVTNPFYDKQIFTHNIEVDKLKAHIQQLYYEKKFYNPMKMVKRMWSIARFNKDIPIIKKLTPLLRSDVSRIYQVKGSLDAYILYVQFSKIDKKHYKNENNYYDKFIVIKNFIMRELGLVVQFNFNKQHKQILDLMNNVTKKNLEDTLNRIRDIIVNIINKYTEIYLKKVKLSKPPRKYLPNIMKYKY